MKLINTELRNELKENIDEKITMDDFTQYFQAASVYVLNNVGIPGKHNFKDLTVELITPYRLDILLLRFLVPNTYGKNIKMSTFGMGFLDMQSQLELVFLESITDVIGFLM